ncbi:MAG: glycosyltransferase family 9 protein [Bdellovibrionales bacterium]|jgi:ADP-heptose:LPS heptosyltransferase
MKERILVIKLGALGDLVLCMGAFAAIRAAHPEAEIALLTAPPFAAFGLSMPWFDLVLLDPRPKVWQPLKWIKLLRLVRAFAPTRVYDFQGKPRQSILFHALGKPEWSGAVKGCRFPRPWPPAPKTHYTDFLAAQLEAAGIKEVQPPDLSWLAAPMKGVAIPEKYVLLIAGCAPDRLYKRWPPESFAALAQKLAEKGIVSIAVGTKADAQSIAAIRALAPEVMDLSGQTTLAQLATLARGAECVVGNDTGPTHLAAVVGARTVALMSDQVDPYWSSPRGAHTTWLQGKPLAALSVEAVIESLGLTRR